MRKSSPSNNGSVKVSRSQREKLLDILQPNTKEIVKESIEAYISNGTKFMLELLMHAEARELCGTLYERQKKRQASRWGTEKKATAIVGAVRTNVERPRIRALRNMNGEGGEIPLETYKVMNRTELLDGPLVAAILSGVSARRYASIVSRGLEAKGIKRSSISRKTIAATKPTVEQFRQRRLDDQDFVVLILDGVHVAKRQIIACIGIDMNGRKHVLGIRLGATENEIVCRDLIRELIERGISCRKQYLFVIDGSKALASSIRAAFGQDAQIQRCQEHKIRDVQAYLPVKLRNEFRDKMQAAYNQRSEKSASKRLSQIRLELSLISDNAVNALTEGMRETLTLHRLGITGSLRKSLRTTNIIESAFSSVRRYMGRVTRFRDEAHRELWTMRSLIEAERHFRTVPGNRQLRKLRTAMELEQSTMNPEAPNHV